VGLFAASLVRSEDALGDVSRGVVILKFVEIGRFEWPGIPKGEKRGDPAKSEKAEERRCGLGYQICIVERSFWRRRTRIRTEDVEDPDGSNNARYRLEAQATSKN
jgi:hypothetical protein